MILFLTIVLIGVDSENILMYNKEPPKEPNCSPPVATKRLSDKTIKLNKRKKQNGWSPFKLDNLTNNSEGILLF